MTSWWQAGVSTGVLGGEEEQGESVNLLPGVTSDLWPTSNAAIDLSCFPQPACQCVIKPMGIPGC